MILFELLETIHKYYPVGMPQMFSVYPGYKAMQRITEEKISLVQKNKDYEWTSLVKELEAQFSRYKILNLSYFQFPSYSVKIEIESRDIGDCAMVSYVVLNMSLLCNYYTVFGEDIYKLENYKSNNSSGEPIIFRTVYNKQTDKKLVLESIELIKTAFENRFKHYKFAEHNILFDYSVLGTGAFGDMEIDPLKDCPSIFRLLFENDISQKPICLV